MGVTVPADICFPWYRLGLVTPHRTTMSVYQAHRLAPEGVVYHLSALDLQEYSLDAVRENLADLWRCVDTLAADGVDRIVVCGVPVAAALGRDEVLGLQEEIAARCGIETGSSFEDHVAALRQLGARRVAVANRWPAELNRAVAEYLGQAGFEVLGSRYGGKTLQENKRASPEGDHDEALALGRAALSELDGADALLLPGGNGYFIYAAPLLEEEFGVPVLTNATATLWAALDAHDGPLLRRPDPGWGKLLGML